MNSQIYFLSKRESFERLGGIPILIRWISDYNCKPTEWWYTIKDTPFNIADLKVKRRYEINKGKKNFNIQIIDLTKYIEEILDVEKKHGMHGLKNTDRK